MSRLTLLSKFLLAVAFVGFWTILVVGCYSCSGCNRQNYNQGYYQDQGYQQPPVYQPTYQTVYREDGSSFIMTYLMWSSLMSQPGGQTNVYNYYDSHKNEDEFRSDRQQQYKQAAENEVKTQKSQFGAKQTETNKSNGFGSQQTKTKSSNGFGSSSSDSYSSPSTSRSPGFGSANSSSSTRSLSPATQTRSSSGFGSRPSSPSPSRSTSTSRSSGFGKKN